MAVSFYFLLDKDFRNDEQIGIEAAAKPIQTEWVQRLQGKNVDRKTPNEGVVEWESLLPNQTAFIIGNSGQLMANSLIHKPLLLQDIPQIIAN